MRLSKNTDRPDWIGGLDRGDHLCLIYETEKARRAVLTPFLRQGLARGEKVLYVTGHHSVEGISAYVQRGFEAEPYLSRGQLVVLASDAVPLQPDALIPWLQEEIAQALSAGYTALRVTIERTIEGAPDAGNAPKARISPSEEIVQEAKLNVALHDSPCLILCQYDRRHCPPEVLLDVLRTHPLAVIGTQRYENFHYIPPRAFLGETPQATQLQSMIHSLEACERMKDALRESEDRFRRLSEASEEGLAIHDQGVVVDANEALARMSGYESRALVGMSLEKLVTPESWRVVWEHIVSGYDQPYQAVGLRKDGSTTHWELVGKPYHHRGKTLRVAAFRDITARQRAVTKLEETTAQFESFLDNSPALVTIFDQEGRYLLANRAAVQTIGVPQAQLVGRTFADLFPPDVADRFIKRVQEMVETGKPLEVDDRVWMNGGEKVFHTTLFPIREHKGTPATFGAIATDVTALRQVEDSLRESEERYRTVVESANEAVAMVNREGVFLFMNGFAAQKLGGEPQDFIGKTMNDLFPPDVAGQHMAHIQQVIQKDRGKTFENTTILQDKTRWYCTSLQPVHDRQGDVSAVLVVAHDVTERNLAKQELEETLAWYRTIFQGSRDAILISDENSRLVSVNAAACELIGYTEGELLGMHIPDLHQDIDRGAYQDYHRHIMAGGTITRGARIPHQDGTQVDVEFSSQRVIIAGQPYMHTVIRDITERKAAESAQRREAARFKALFDHAPVGIRLLDSQGHPFLSNAAFQQMLGYTAEELKGTDFVAFTHPDDVQADRALYQELVSGKRDSYVIEKRYYHRDGRLIWGQLSVAAVRSEPGEIIYVIGMVRDITERKQAEAELRESQARFALFMDHLPGAAFIKDRTGRMIYCNAYYAMISGQKPSDLIGRTAKEYVPSEIEATFAHENAAILNKNQSMRFDHTYPGPEGPTHWLTVKFPIQRQGQPSLLGAISLDITAKKNLEQETELLYEISRDLNQVMDEEDLLIALTRPAAALGADAAGLFYINVDGNGAPLWVERVAAWRRQGHATLPVGTCTPLSDAPLVRQWITMPPDNPLIITNLLEDERIDAQTREVMIQNGGGQAVVLIPLSHGQDHVGLVAFSWSEPHAFSEEEARIYRTLLDLAVPAVERQRLVRALEKERTLLAERVTERTADLRRANAELTRAVRAKDEFLATMSHELRTPLNAILGKTETLQEGIYGTLNEKQIHSLDTIEQSGRHLLSLINDILDVAKIESGKLALCRGPVSLPATCEASLRMVKQMAQRKRIKLLSTLDNDVAARPVYLDGRRLQQILVNLLNNAIKFTPQGGQIGLEVVGDVAAAVIHFTVWDTGIGIAQEDMERLFQPFVQLDSSLSRQYTGTGLGLTLVARLAEMHGGGVKVESDVGQGSRFTVSLPWKKTLKQTSPAAPEASAPSASVARRDGKEAPSITASALDTSQDRPLILLVEDDETSISTVSEYLEALGYRVQIARDGVAALKCARAARPGVILMDIQMPGMDGLEATRRIRADDDLQDVPIIALTALAMPGDRARCIMAGADAYLSKPVKLQHLVNAIKTQLSASTEK